MVEGILDGIDDVAFCRLHSQDVVRHKLVGKIVDAYAVTTPSSAAAAQRSRAAARRGTPVGRGR